MGEVPCDRLSGDGLARPSWRREGQVSESHVMILCVAQSGRAPALGAGWQRFESSRADQNAHDDVAVYPRGLSATRVDRPKTDYTGVLRQAGKPGSSDSKTWHLFRGLGRVVQAAAFQAAYAGSIPAARSITSLGCCNSSHFDASPSGGAFLFLARVLISRTQRVPHKTRRLDAAVSISATPSRACQKK